MAELAVAHVDMKVRSTTEAGVIEARKVSQPFLRHRGFRDFILNPKLRELLRQLLGGREPLLVTDQIFMKPPRHGSPKHHHQDNAYFQCDPALIDVKRQSCAVVKRGGVVFHHGNTLHCSGANRTDRWRRAYASHWVTAADVTCRASTLDDAYFKLADYPRP